MLIKTRMMGLIMDGELTWSEPTEIWVNPKLVAYVLPNHNGIKLLGDEHCIRLTDDGFERFCKMYEQVDGL